jgi:hypothetical protein
MRQSPWEPNDRATRSAASPPPANPIQTESARVAAILRDERHACMDAIILSQEGSALRSGRWPEPERDNLPQGLIFVVLVPFQRPA